MMKQKTQEMTEITMFPKGIRWIQISITVVCRRREDYMRVERRSGAWCDDRRAESRAYGVVVLLLK
jgi:hypothetical protein